MRILVGGGTGFIGQALVSALAARGDDVLILSRTGGTGKITWDALRKEGLPPCEAVVNLAGTNIMAKRWTRQYKEEIFSSRIDTTQLLAHAIRKAASPPSVFLNASAIAYYSPERQATEQEGRPGSDFLSLVAQQWEAAATLSAPCPTRTVLLRIGVVLSPRGGMLKRILPIFRTGLGGPIGSGAQPMCWIHIDDLVALMLFALDHPFAGPLNGVAPHPVTMAEFSTALGHALGKPAKLPVPSWAIKLLLGERAEVVLSSPYVIPEKAMQEGFPFAYPSLDQALRNLFH